MSSLDEYNARREHEKERKKSRRRALAKHKKLAREKITEEGRCRNPSCVSSLKPEWHHLVPRSKFGKYDPRVHDVDNAAPLCHDCHMRWHQNITILHRSDLSVSEVSFIIQVAGHAWIDRHYPE